MAWTFSSRHLRAPEISESACEGSSLGGFSVGSLTWGVAEPAGCTAGGRVCGAEAERRGVRRGMIRVGALEPPGGFPGSSPSDMGPLESYGGGEASVRIKSAAYRRTPNSTYFGPRDTWGYHSMNRQIRQRNRRQNQEGRKTCLPTSLANVLQATWKSPCLFIRLPNALNELEKGQAAASSASDRTFPAQQLPTPFQGRAHQVLSKLWCVGNRITLPPILSQIQGPTKDIANEGEGREALNEPQQC
ncbi:hypothetical protein CROQUDRAFT_92810 [Cronartium quercuum f. sp. fusiforme G11]|uniref:Uncharacterized protein n=1 Tax=Cronartium quercuum f. sp. fusiforme G11 TaxID=708437 RepID=A0A9P6TC43_9BASI|nr:hypothetical protein CROQUDRAFT_92810 [Cronartium quercuum f. sp. fusiforme G11]